jgi:hypothetical protein
MLLSHGMHMDNDRRPGGTVLGNGIWTWLGNSSEALVAFVPPVSIKDRPLHWTLVKSQTYYPEHILAYGSGKTCYSLVMSSGSFWTDWLEAGIGGGLSTTLRPDLKCGGLESKFGRGPGTRDRSGAGWPYKKGRQGTPLRTKNEGRRTKTTRHLPASKINISSNILFFPFLETWDRFPLSQLVTPTQALRCKKIQYFSSPAGRRVFFARTRINSRVFSLHHPPD